MIKKKFKIFDFRLFAKQFLEFIKLHFFIFEYNFIPAQLASQAHCPNEHLIPASVT